MRAQQAGVLAQLCGQARALYVVAQGRVGLLCLVGQRADDRRQHRHHRHHAVHRGPDGSRCALIQRDHGRAVHRCSCLPQCHARSCETLRRIAPERFAGDQGERLLQRVECAIGARAGFRQRLKTLRLRRRSVTEHAVGRTAFARHHLRREQGQVELAH